MVGQSQCVGFTRRSVLGLRLTLIRRMADTFYGGSIYSIGDIGDVKEIWSNKTLEPIRVGAFSSAIAVHVLLSRVAQLGSLGNLRVYEHSHLH